MSLLPIAWLVVATSVRAAPSDVVPPRLISDPFALRPAGAAGEGEVVLEVLVDRNGRVAELSAVTGEEPFLRAALEAARGFRFEPAQRGDKPVAARVRLLIRFPLELESSAPPAETEPAPGPGADRPAASNAPPTAPAPVGEVLVRGRPPLPVRGFTRAEVRVLPGALSDPPRAIEALPGVTPTLSGAPYFFVRGAPPSNVGYFYDGIRLPALFHALAGPSVIHPALIESVALYPGPYPVEYGRYAGGVVVSRAAEPSPAAHGELNVKATDASAFVEAPIGGDATHVLFAGRYAYANPVLHLFASELDVAYWDYQTRLSHQLSSVDRVSLLAFGAHDRLEQTSDGETRTTYGVDFHRVNLRLEHELERGALVLGGLLGTGRSYERNGDVRVDDFSSNVRADLTLELGPNTTLRTGADGGHDAYTLRLGELDDPEARSDFARRFPSRVDMVAGAYVALDLRVTPRLLVTPGLRTDLYTSRGHAAVGVDPRIGSELRVSQLISLRNDFGVATQPPANSVPSPALNPTLGGGLQRSWQQSFGVLLRLPYRLKAELTLFQSATFRLNDGIGQSRFDDADEDVAADTRGTGRARGVELLIRRSLSERIGGYLSYTLSSTERSVGRAHGPASFDRRHVLSGALGYAWGAGVTSGVRGMFYTGVPADVAYLAAARDPPRTAAFYRIDVRTEKTFSLGEGRRLSLVCEVLNATLEKESLSASCNAYRCDERRVGPVTIPNLGVELAF